MLNTIKRNYLYNLSYQVFTLLIPFITTPYVSRVLQPDGVGLYSYANSVATYFSLAAALGIASYGIREIAVMQFEREKSSKLFYELMIIRICATIICFAAYSLFIFSFAGAPEYYFAVGLIIVAMLFDCNWFFQAMESFKMLALRNFIVKGVSVVLIFTFVKSKNDLLIYFLIQSGSVLGSNILILPALRKYLVKVNFHKLEFKRHISQTLVYFVPTIATSIYTVLDKTMIGLITENMSENGFYEQAHRIINMLLTVITSLTTVVGIRTSSLFATNESDEIRDHIRETFRYVSMLAFPLTTGLMACAITFVPWFFGKGYEKAASLLMMFAPLIVVISISNVVGTLYLTPSGQRRRSNKAIIAGAVFNFVLNMVLIPSFNTYGAVIASLCAEILISVLYMHFARDYVSVSQIIKDGFRCFIMAVIMGIIIYCIGCLIQPSAITTVVQVVTGIIIYFAGLVIMRDNMLITAINAVKSKFGKKSRNNP